MVSALVVGRNTWSTLAYANTYADDSPLGTSWDDLDNDDKARRLIHWFGRLERMDWIGTLADVDVVTSAAVTAGGTGYAVGDELTLVGGTLGRAAKVKVATVSAGVITSLSLIDVGSYTEAPSGALSVTGGAGSGATVTPTFGEQSTQFPRVGLTCQGYALPADDVPQRVVDAQVTLSMLAASDEALLTLATTGSNEKRYKAGEVELELFAPTVRGAAPFPPVVMELIGCILKSAQSVPRVIVFGTSETPSIFTDADEYGLSEGYS